MTAHKHCNGIIFGYHAHGVLLAPMMLCRKQHQDDIRTSAFTALFVRAATQKTFTYRAISLIPHTQILQGPYVFSDYPVFSLLLYLC